MANKASGSCRKDGGVSRRSVLKAGAAVAMIPGFGAPAVRLGWVDQNSLPCLAVGESARSDLSVEPCLGDPKAARLLLDAVKPPRAHRPKILKLSAQSGQLRISHRCASA